MDPFTIALAVFGVQKLRGQSTGKSFRDALLAATGAQALSATAVGADLGIKGFTLGAEGNSFRKSWSISKCCKFFSTMMAKYFT
jgi:hypothetical protein